MCFIWTSILMTCLIVGAFLIFATPPITDVKHCPYRVCVCVHVRPPHLPDAMAQFFLPNINVGFVAATASDHLIPLETNDVNRET